VPAAITAVFEPIFLATKLPDLSPSSQMMVFNASLQMPVCRGLATAITSYRIEIPTHKGMALG
jgi:hypothetical protein